MKSSVSGSASFGTHSRRKSPAAEEKTPSSAAGASQLEEAKLIDLKPCSSGGAGEGRDHLVQADSGGTSTAREIGRRG